MTSGEVIFLLAIAVVFILAFAWPVLRRRTDHDPNPRDEARPSPSIGRPSKAFRQMLAGQDKIRHSPASPPATDFTAIEIKISHSASHRDDDDDDDDYQWFVHRTWNDPENIALNNLTCTVNGQDAILHSLSARHGSPYVNLVLVATRERKTLVADRHRWARAGGTIDPSAFSAVLIGVAPETALQPDTHPNSPEEAAERDRFPTEAKRFLLHYRSNAGEHWRVVSRLQRGDGEIYARCHFRWGESRRFRNDRIIGLVDADTGEMIDLAAYLAKRIALPRKPRQRP